MRRYRGVVIGLAALLAVLVAAPAASASFHLIKISEVSADSDGGGGFIELQMIASGQTFLTGRTITTYKANGAVDTTSALTSDADNGQNQRTYLIGANLFTGHPDETLAVATSLDDLTAGGAVCWDQGIPPDCVSWGNFTGDASLPGPGAGTPAPALVDSKSLTRDFSAGCASAMEAGDDSNDSAADFSLQPITPTANTDPAPTRACPNTKITDGPKAKTEKATARFSFKSTPKGAKFQCKLDGGKFAKCGSDASFRVGVGKHKLSVRAVNDLGGVDATPATYAWKRTG
jgi:hypothetical protein